MSGRQLNINERCCHSRLRASRADKGKKPARRNASRGRGPSGSSSKALSARRRKNISWSVASAPPLPSMRSTRAKVSSGRVIDRSIPSNAAGSGFSSARFSAANLPSARGFASVNHRVGNYPKGLLFPCAGQGRHKFPGAGRSRKPACPRPGRELALHVHSRGSGT